MKQQLLNLVNIAIRDSVENVSGITIIENCIVASQKLDGYCVYYKEESRDELDRYLKETLEEAEYTHCHSILDINPGRVLYLCLRMVGGTSFTSLFLSMFNNDEQALLDSVAPVVEIQEVGEGYKDLNEKSDSFADDFLQDNAEFVTSEKQADIDEQIDISLDSEESTDSFDFAEDLEPSNAADSSFMMEQSAVEDIKELSKKLANLEENSTKISGTMQRMFTLLQDTAATLGLNVQADTSILKREDIESITQLLDTYSAQSVKEILINSLLELSTYDELRIGTEIIRILFLYIEKNKIER